MVNFLNIIEAVGAKHFTKYGMGNKPIYSIRQEICIRFLLCVVFCCGYTLADFPLSIRPTSLALWQSNDCPSASKATLMNMDKYFMWIHYERLHNHNKAKHNKKPCAYFSVYTVYTVKQRAFVLIMQNWTMPWMKQCHIGIIFTVLNTTIYSNQLCAILPKKAGRIICSVLLYSQTDVL